MCCFEDLVAFCPDLKLPLISSTKKKKFAIFTPRMFRLTLPVFDRSGFFHLRVVNLPFFSALVSSPEQAIVTLQRAALASPSEQHFLLGDERCRELLKDGCYK